MKKKNQNQGDSNFQLMLERKIIENRGLKYKKFQFGEFSVEVDGYSDDKKEICEVYAHIGKLKSGQIHKVAQDILKLIFLDEILQVKHAKVLLFVDEDARKPFEDEGRKWIANSIQKFGIKTYVYSLSSKDRKELMGWQKKQGEKFRK